MPRLIGIAVHIAGIAVLASSAAAAPRPDAFNVVWDSPSQDSSGSMPLGNGDIGVNVWVENSGDIVFYVSKTDAWSETGRLLKLGRVRVRLSPSPFGGGQPFQQTLRLGTGDVSIVGGAPGAQARASMWVDANHPVIRLEIVTDKSVAMQAMYERWRDQPRLLEGRELGSAYGLEGGPEPVVSYPDIVAVEDPARVAWYHRNTRSVYPPMMKHQGLGGLLSAFPDPLLNRTFGGLMEGAGLTRRNATTLRSKEPALRHTLSVFALTSIADSSEDWLRQVQALAARVNAGSLAQQRIEHERWWSHFWGRSWIHVQAGGEGEAVSRGYALQRFVTACAGRGAFPIKFNGSIFTVDAVEGEERFDADYRRWGGPYWFQNTRLIYWPMPAAGDLEMMLPLFRMYSDALPLARERTRLYFNHAGAFFPETMYFWGAYASSNYGWQREGKPAGLVENTYIRHYYSLSLELLALMVEYHAHTEDKQFARGMLAPLARDVLLFYDQHYGRKDGRIVFAPAQALETWPEVVNPLPEIAGLRYVTGALLAAKVPLDRETNTTAKRILEQLPELPVREQDGRTVLAPASEIKAKSQNTENPELYAVFPYRIYGINKPGYDIGRASFELRRHKGTGGWRQDAIQAAYMGMSQVASNMVVENFTAKHEGSRFPGFWGPNFDWVPDQDHGSVAMMALQTMLMCTEGEKIVLFPAWPKQWDVEFKLHAPKNTTVEGVFRGGRLESLRVTPADREADIVKLTPQ